MDIVYVVGPGDRNNELRYSLRSLVNLPHGLVWIAGYRPSWVDRSVGEIAVPQDGTKWENTSANLLAACQPGAPVTDDFLLFNDDFYIMSPLEEMPVLHRGPMRNALSYYHYTKSRYAEGMRETHRLLRRLGYKEPLSYELHVPMALNKPRVRETLRVAGEAGPFAAAHKRTLYGNMWSVGGEQIEDVKVPNRGPLLPGPLLSTGTLAWPGPISAHLKNVFPDRSEYERR